MNKEYSEWSLKKRIEFWYGQAIFFDRMQSSVSDGHKNIGLYFMNKKTKESLQEYEKDWNQFAIIYCDRFKINHNIGQELFELDPCDERWKELSVQID